MPKQKNTKFKRGLSLVAAVAMVASAIMPATKVFAAWPERAEVDGSNPPSDVVFNSIVERGSDGAMTYNEMEFVYIREWTGDDSTEFKPYTTGSFKIEPGKTYQVYIYYHNNGATNKNLSFSDNQGYVNRAGEDGGQAVAYGARARSKFPSVVTNDASASYEISAAISAENMVLKKSDGSAAEKADGMQYQVADTLYLTTDSEVPVSLKYVEGSARIYNQSSAVDRSTGETKQNFSKEYFEKMLGSADDNGEYFKTVENYNLRASLPNDGDYNEDGKVDHADYIAYAHAKGATKSDEELLTALHTAIKGKYDEFVNKLVEEYVGIREGMWDIETDANGNRVLDEYGFKGGKDISGKYLFVDNVLDTSVGQPLGFSDNYCAESADGSQKFCGLNGILPGCSEYSGHIAYLIKAEAMDSTISKSASLDGEHFSSSVDAKPGDTVTYRVEWTNTGTGYVDADFKDILPEGVTLVPGSFKSCAIKNDGDMTDKCSPANYLKDDASLFEHTMNDESLTNGVILGNHIAPRQGFVVMYKTTVDAKDANGAEICVDRNVVNTAFVKFSKSDSSDETDRRSSSASSTIVVRTNCTTTTTVPELPKTGPSEIALALVAAVSATVGGVYWYRGQKELAIEGKKNKK